MNKYTNKKKNIKPIKIEEQIKASFHLGGTMVVEPDFDVKKYLNLFEGRGLDPKNFQNNNLLNSTYQYSTFNLDRKPLNSLIDAYKTTIFNNTLTPNKKLNKGIMTFNSEQKLLNTASTGYADNFQTNYNYHLPFTKNSTKLFYNKKFNTKYSKSKPSEYFNVFKAVKEIKNTARIPKAINKIKSYNNKKSIYITDFSNDNQKVTERSPIAYRRDYIDTVFDSKKVINNYRMRKGLELDPCEDLVTFHNKKKEISVNNVLITVLNNESKKLALKENDIKANNEKNKNILNNNLKSFEEFKDKHKRVCKKFEKTFDNLQNENNLLMKELISYNTYKKNYEDEIQKHLEYIEILRLYALFVHQALGKDISRYEKRIFPDNRNIKSEEYENKIEKIRKFVIDNYSIFWDDKYKSQLKEELKFLQQPDLLLDKIEEVERNIMRLLHLKNNIDKEIIMDEVEHKKILDALKVKYEKEENQTQSFLNEINIESNDINNYIKIENQNNSDIIELIGELFFSIVETFGHNDKNRYLYKSILNNKVDKGNVNICIKEGERILREQEEKLNKALISINTFQENDERFFNKIMEEAKKKNKAEKQLLFKKGKIDKQLEFEVDALHKFKKLSFIPRKVAASYNFQKKKVKKTIDHELEKRLEDEEMIKYK